MKKILGTLNKVLGNLYKNADSISEIKETANDIRTAIECVQKQIPVKPINYEDKMWGCPTCHNYLMHIWVQYPIERTPKECGLAYCLNCGQAIDWSEDEQDK